MRTFTPVDDFVISGGGAIDPARADALRQWARRTGEFLDKAGNAKPRMSLTGSFICAHPPDYRGRPAHHFSVAEWQVLFREFKELGMDTVIWQASAWRELKECYYPSKRLSHFRQWNVVEPMLAAAAAEGLTVFLGSYGVLGGGWGDGLGVDTGDMARVREAADVEIACVRELLGLYGGGFQGFYLSSELCYHWSHNPRQYDHFGELFERVTGEMKERAPGLPVLASPAVLKTIGYEREAVANMVRCLGRARVDIVAPQDCIGQGEDLEYLGSNLEVWRTICEEIGARFWSNVETFAFTDHGQPPIEAAEPRRVFCQMAMAEAQGAEKLVTWEAMHFLDPNGPPKARALRNACLFAQGQ